MSIQSEIKRKPVDNFKVDTPFGWRTHPINKKKDFHNGIDISLPMGTPGYAIAKGKVLISEFHKSLGWYLVISHLGFLTVYTHLQKKGVASGKIVNPGDVVGYVGTSGSSTGPHLHFEIREGIYKSNAYFWNRGKDSNGQYPNSIDPSKFFSEEPIHIQIIRETQNSPEQWIEFIKKFESDPLGRYFPQFITNIRNKHEKQS